MRDNRSRSHQGLQGCALATAMALSGLLPIDQAAAQATDPEDKRTLAVQITEAALKSLDLQQLSIASLDQFARNFPNKSPEFRTVLISLAPVIKDEIAPMIREITVISARYYEEKFETDELRQIRDFTTSPVGQKQAKLGSEFAARFAVTLQQTMVQRTPAIEAKIKAELTRRGYKL